LALQGGRRATQKTYATDPVGTPNGHIARVIAHSFLLLEARVVLFVDDHEAQRAHRREQRAPRPDGHVDLAVAEPPPHQMPLARREAGMQNGHVVPEARPKAGDELRRECDLRYEHDGPPGAGASG